MTSKKTWLLIADASKARLYSLHKACLFQENHDHLKDLELVNEFSHENSRKKNHELTTDTRGRFGPTNFTVNVTPKEHEAEQFAREIVAHLEMGRKNNCFRDLVVASPPKFMGLLNKHLSIETERFITKRIEKDFTHQNEHELINNLVTLL